jgi:hypothetical protein
VVGLYCYVPRNTKAGGPSFVGPLCAIFRLGGM